MQARLFGHPIHQMLIVFPLGLLGTSLLFDILHLATGGEHWALVSYYMIVAGILSGLLAAPFGLIDWLRIPLSLKATGRLTIASGKDGLYLAPFNAIDGVWKISWTELESAAWKEVEETEIRAGAQ